MKKHLIITIAISIICPIYNAIALSAINPGGGSLIDGPSIANNCNGGEAYYKICMTGVTYQGCSQQSCITCEGSGISDAITPNNYGVVVINTSKYTTNCPSSQYGTATCSCKTSTTYKCGEGYYGTATSASAGCTKCPSNATCKGGNGSTFLCNKGYYKNGTSCERCRASGGVYGTTASTGATTITECYLPSGTAFSDSTGSGKYTANCYYKN